MGLKVIFSNTLSNTRIYIKICYPQQAIKIDHIWRKIYNRELENMFRDLEAIIRIDRLKTIGHTNDIDTNVTIKMASIISRRER